MNYKNLSDAELKKFYLDFKRELVRILFEMMRRKKLKK